MTQSDLRTIIKDMSPENQTEQDEMKVVFQAYSKHREVSAQESVARTCSLKIKSCSCEVLFLQTSDNALRMSLPLSALQKKPEESENVWMMGMPDKYRARPETPEFKNMCIADFASDYRIAYGKEKEDGKRVSLLNNMGMIQKRTRGKLASDMLAFQKKRTLRTSTEDCSNSTSPIGQSHQ